MSAAGSEHRIVTCVRVVAHSKGRNATEDPTAPNHWSIYLILQDGGSVRLNMRSWRAGDGTYEVTTHPYALVDSQLLHWDFAATRGVRVGQVLDLVKQKGRHRYRTTEAGVGCRHWVWTIIDDLAAVGLVAPDAGDAVRKVVQYNYSSARQRRASEVHEGVFFQVTAERSVERY